MRTNLNSLLILILIAVFGILLSSCQFNTTKSVDWQDQFQQQLPLLGHRNWVLVVDKAFPLQSAQGMTVINTGEQLPEVLQCVMGSISTSTHVKPNVYTDLEFAQITEDLSPGVDELKKSIAVSLKNYPQNTLLHNDVFAKLDSASNLFEVLVLKTESTIPYSSVFIQLDCKYWSAEKEQKLRSKMQE
jgi:hypothetical protein